MKKLFIFILISIIISTTFFSCTGVGVSYGVGFGGVSGPYGYGRYHPRVNVGVYGGGYGRLGY